MKYTVEEVKFIRQKKKEQREYKKAILEKGDQLQKLLDEGKLIKHENKNKNKYNKGTVPKFTWD